MNPSPKGVALLARDGKGPEELETSRNVRKRRVPAGRKAGGHSAEWRGRVMSPKREQLIGQMLEAELQLFRLVGHMPDETLERIIRVMNGLVRCAGQIVTQSRPRPRPIGGNNVIHLAPADPANS